MALSKEDKADVKGAMGKALANKVSKVTRDRKPYDKELHTHLKTEHGEKEGNSRYEKYRSHKPQAYVGGKKVDVPSPKSKALSKKGGRSMSDAMTEGLKGKKHFS